MIGDLKDNPLFEEWQEAIWNIGGRERRRVRVSSLCSRHGHTLTPGTRRPEHHCPRSGHQSPGLALTIITVEETLSGWYSLLRRVRTDARLEAAYDGLTATMGLVAHSKILSFSRPAISRFRALAKANSE